MSQPWNIEFRCSYTRKRTAARVSAGQDYVIGSDSGNEIVLEGPDMQPRHARIGVAENRPTIEPIAEAPVAVNGEPVSGPVGLCDGDWLGLGGALFQVRYPQPTPVSIYREKSRTDTAQPLDDIVNIGRMPECDLQIDSPLVSREHACLRWKSGHWVLEDLHSTNGTFVNGQRLVGQVKLRPGDRMAIATFAFLFTGEALEPIDTAGRVRVEVRDLCKEVVDRSSKQPRRLLDQINLVIEPGEFVVIFGTSGSGKSTLLDALNGRRPATSGKVLYNDMDLYGAFDLFRSAIGYVPQEDIVHRKITVEHALRYTARLRLPPDTSNEEIDAHITRVLDKVGLGEKATLPIDTPAPLSGGQLKRVSLAVELVANPNILFLDEVTSGLDVGTDKRMMRLFADLAADQKTVICVTHTLENIEACHLVVLLHQGRLVYFGPPQEAPGYFGVQRLSEVYELLEFSPAEVWAERFLHTPFYKTYITERLTEATPAPDVAPKPAKVSVLKTLRRWFDWRQAAILMRRYVDLMLADRRNLAILFLQAPLIAAMIGLVFDTEGPPLARTAAESQVSFMLVLSAIWFGCLNSAREVVKELPIYLRERSVNLNLGAYLMSKAMPLAILCALQCLMLLGIVSPLVSLSGSFAKQALILFFASLSATSMGLTVSAMVNTNDKAVAIVPILLVPQVVLSNAVVALDGVSRSLAQATIISFSAFDAMKAALGAEILEVKDPVCGRVITLSSDYWSDLTVTTILGVGFLITTFVGLRLKDRRG